MCKGNVGYLLGKYKNKVMYDLSSGYYTPLGMYSMCWTFHSLSLTGFISWVSVTMVMVRMTTMAARFQMEVGHIPLYSRFLEKNNQDTTEFR